MTRDIENKNSDMAVISSDLCTLDGNGNRIRVEQNEPLAPVIPVGVTSYGYNTKKNRLLTAGAETFSYDDEGQLSTGYGVSYTFDYEHRLKTIGSSIQFFYDGAGNRLQATRSGVTTRYIYDAGGNLLAEADGSNTILRYYIHGLGLLAMVTPSNQVYCYHFNAVGSTIAVTDQNQAMLNKYAYDPFGNILNQVEAVTQPFKFVGQYGVMTEPNGFYYMRARYYDPKVGRFISEDPIGFDGGDVNLMVYVGNNPVNLIDPDGEIVIAPLLSFAVPKVAAMVITYLAFKSTMGVADLASGGRVDNQAVNQAMNRAFAVSAAQIGAAGAIYGGVAAAPAISTAIISSPQLPTRAVEFFQGYHPQTGPPSTRAGYVGLAFKTGQDFLTSVYQNYSSGRGVSK